MFLCDLGIEVNPSLLQGSELHRPVSGFFDDLIFHPVQSPLIVSRT